MLATVAEMAVRVGPVTAVSGPYPLPKEISLAQNYPNPFNPVTTIRYELPHQSHVSLNVFNYLGQEVATLVDEQESAGYKSVKFDASGLPSGVYLYRLEAGDFSVAKRMTLVK